MTLRADHHPGRRSADAGTRARHKINALMHRPFTGEGIDAPAIARRIPLCFDRQAGGQQALPDPVLEHLGLDHGNRIGLRFDLICQRIDRTLQFG